MHIKEKKLRYFFSTFSRKEHTLTSSPFGKNDIRHLIRTGERLPDLYWQSLLSVNLR